MEPVTVACVLYKGRDVPAHSKGIFTPEWADRLYRGVARNTTRPFRFICYTDAVYGFREPVEQRPLALPYRNMLSLLEAFREDLGRVLFFGLDTIIVGDIDRLMDYDGPFAMLPDPLVKRPCSGVMAFPYTPGIWQAFIADHERHATKHRIGRYPSDMIFLATQPHTLLDDTGIYSFKKHCRFGLPPDASVVYFHGRPKIEEVTTGVNRRWIAKHWV